MSIQIDMNNFGPTYTIDYNGTKSQGGYFPPSYLIETSGLLWKGDFVFTDTYSPNDFLRYTNFEGKKLIYFCKKTSTENLPSNTDYFDVMFEDGKDGRNFEAQGEWTSRAYNYLDFVSLAGKYYYCNDYNGTQPADFPNTSPKWVLLFSLAEFVKSNGATGNGQTIFGANSDGAYAGLTLQASNFPGSVGNSVRVKLLENHDFIIRNRTGADKITFKEDGSIRQNTNEILSSVGDMKIHASTSSTSSSTGALTIAGGVGIAKSLNVAGAITAPNATINTINTNMIDSNYNIFIDDFDGIVPNSLWFKSENVMTSYYNDASAIHLNGIDGAATYIDWTGSPSLNPFRKHTIMEFRFLNRSTGSPFSFRASFFQGSKHIGVYTDQADLQLRLMVAPDIATKPLLNKVIEYDKYYELRFETSSTDLKIYHRDSYKQPWTLGITRLLSSIPNTMFDDANIDGKYRYASMPRIQVYGQREVYIDYVKIFQDRELYQ